MVMVSAEALWGGSPTKVHLSDRMDFSLESVKNSSSNCRYEISPSRAITAPTLLNSPLLNNKFVAVWISVYTSSNNLKKPARAAPSEGKSDISLFFINIHIRINNNRRIRKDAHPYRIDPHKMYLAINTEKL